MTWNRTAAILTVTLLAALRLASTPSAPAPASARIDALREKLARQDEARVSAMTKAVELARKALEAGKQAGPSDRVEMLNRRFMILNERLDLLKQIAGFQLQRFDADRRGDDQGRREAQHRIDTAYTLIDSRQAEERELRQKLEVKPK